MTSEHAAAAQNVRLLQNCIEDRHLGAIIPGFESLDFRHNPRPELREFQIFDELYARGEHRSAEIVGAVSSRFLAKGLIDGHEVRRWIEANPGFDVYVTNPFPQYAYASFNNMERARITHRDPELGLRYQRVLNKAGVDLDMTDVGRQHNGNYGLNSYWFGSARFWDRFMLDLVLPVIRLTRGELGSELHDFLYAPTPYWGVATHRPGNLPFLIERATSLFIQREFAQSSLHYSHTRCQILACCVYPFERDIVRLFADEVDAWDRSGCYEARAKAYFEHANQHVMRGRQAYILRYPLDFGNGDPRLSFPWNRCEGSVG